VLAFSLVWAGEKLFSLPADPLLKWFVFFSTVLVYNFDRIANLIPDRHASPARAGFFRKNRKIFILITAASLLPLTWIILQLSLDSLIWFTPLGVLTLLYLYFFGWRSQKRDRTAWLKPLLLSIVWTTVVVAAPFITSSSPLSKGALWLWGIRFLEYFTNGILFDFRDIAGDTKEQKANFVAFSGFRQSVVISFVSSLIALAMTSYALATQMLPRAVSAEIPVTLLYLAITWRVYSTGEAPLQKELHYALFLDGALFLPVLFIMAGV